MPVQTLKPLSARQGAFIAIGPDDALMKAVLPNLQNHPFRKYYRRLRVARGSLI